AGRKRTLSLSRSSRALASEALERLVQLFPLLVEYCQAPNSPPVEPTMARPLSPLGEVTSASVMKAPATLPTTSPFGALESSGTGVRTRPTCRDAVAPAELNAVIPPRLAGTDRSAVPPTALLVWSQARKSSEAVPMAPLGRRRIRSVAPSRRAVA